MPIDDEFEAHLAGRGRSAKKREAQTVAHLAQRLAELSHAQIAKLPPDPELKREVALACDTRGHSSRKRQIKHLARYLRSHGEQREEVQAVLDGQAVRKHQEVTAFQYLEDLRDRLCEADTYEAALTEVRTRYPHLDDRKLIRLATSVHNIGDKKSFREVFRRLRMAEEADEANEADEADEANEANEADEAEAPITS